MKSEFFSPKALQKKFNELYLGLNIVPISYISERKYIKIRHTFVVYLIYILYKTYSFRIDKSFYFFLRLSIFLWVW